MVLAIPFPFVHDELHLHPVTLVVALAAVFFRTSHTARPGQADALPQRGRSVSNQRARIPIPKCVWWRCFSQPIRFLNTPPAAHTVQITSIFIGQTHLVFGKRVCTCVTKHSNAFRTFLNWLKNSKCVWHVWHVWHVWNANFDLWSVSVVWVLFRFRF